MKMVKAEVENTAVKSVPGSPFLREALKSPGGRAANLKDLKGKISKKRMLQLMEEAKEVV